MITDQETNIVYLSSVLKGFYNSFWNELKIILNRNSIQYRWIEETRSIWCRDYMPVQVGENDFVQFKYFPDYYLDYSFIGYLTLQYEIEYDEPENLRYMMDLTLDGGNIVRSKDKVIITEKVFKDNDNRRKDIVSRMLQKTLKTENIYFIPVQPFDITGHADGMVRFYDENTLLVNEFKESPGWMNKLDRSLRKTGLEIKPFPYFPSDKKINGEFSAHGCYINFAQLGNLIIFPQFGGEYLKYDKIALDEIVKLYPAPDYKIEAINADPIAWHGGVLNCCTWNVRL